MIRFLENLAISIERNLKNTQVAFRIYSVIFAFCFIVFGIYGIRPLGRILSQKVQIFRDSDIAYKILQANLDAAQQASKDIADNKNSIAALNRYMPKETSAQTYMLDFIDAIGTSGFSLKYFTQNDSHKPSGQVELSISLEGLTYPSDMLKNIEALKRVTQVTRLNMYQNSKGVLTIVVDLNIFTLPL